ncbi:MAG: HipA N-terminal domain-containing protein [Desulfobacteraceae bacterium]|nr:HipA N-terminal domain-containing protein [Desulfobacteraceae bacterium]
MRRAEVFLHNLKAGLLEEIEAGTRYRFYYESGYSGPPVSLTMPVQEEPHEYDVFPPFFEGLLPEGFNLEALLRQNKIDRNDLFSQLMAVGEDMVGAVTVREVE